MTDNNEVTASTTEFFNKTLLYSLSNVTALFHFPI